VVMVEQSGAGIIVVCFGPDDPEEEEVDDDDDDDDVDDDDGDDERGDGENTGVYGSIACSWATTGTCCWEAATNSCELI